MMGNTFQILPDSEKDQLWTSYTKQQCSHIHNDVYDSTLINAKIETKFPFQNINKSNVSVLPEEIITIDEREEKIRKIKRQLEDEGTELAISSLPIILSESFITDTLENEEKTPIIKSAGGILVDFMSDGAKRFEKEAGRPMTYSEMRELWG